MVSFHATQHNACFAQARKYCLMHKSIIILTMHSLIVVVLIMQLFT